jgi:hypothetical protein
MLALSDAIFMNYANKIGAVVACTIVSILLLILLFFNMIPYQSRNVVVFSYISYDTKALALDALLTFSIFQVKYLHNVVCYPGSLIILNFEDKRCLNQYTHRSNASSSPSPTTNQG